MPQKERAVVVVPRAQTAVNGWQRDLGRLVFTVRHVTILALALLTATAPSIGPNRWWITAAVLGIVLPWDLVMHWRTRRTGLPPVLMPLDNQLFCAAFIALAPTVSVPFFL